MTRGERPGQIILSLTLFLARPSGIRAVRISKLATFASFKKRKVRSAWANPFGLLVESLLQSLRAKMVKFAMLSLSTQTQVNGGKGTSHPAHFALLVELQGRLQSSIARMTSNLCVNWQRPQDRPPAKC